MCFVTNTPPKDIVAHGGWAGVPKLAKVATEAPGVLSAWKKSMTHLHCDRRNENEEWQKLLHMEMLENLIAMVHDMHGNKEAATWDRVQEAAAQLQSDGYSAVAHVRSMAMDAVAKGRQNLTVEPLFGVAAEVRRQFKVSFIRGMKRPTLSKAAVRQATAQSPAAAGRERPEFELWRVRSCQRERRKPSLTGGFLHGSQSDCRRCASSAGDRSRSFHPAVRGRCRAPFPRGTPSPEETSARLK